MDSCANPSANVDVVESAHQSWKSVVFKDRSTIRGLYTVVPLGANRFRNYNSKIAMFHLEGGLLKKKKRGDKNKKDLNWIVQVAPARIKEVYEQGYEIVIVTEGKSKADVETMGERLYAALQIPIVFIGGHTDPYYNRPHVGFWHLIDEYFCCKRVLKGESFYVGDEDVDAAFAWNARLAFRSSQEFWQLGEGESGLMPRLRANLLEEEGLVVIGKPPQIARLDKLQLVLTVGPRSSGKNKISHGLLYDHDYERVNAFGSKNPTYQLKQMKKAIAKRRSILIDCCNPTAEEREVWISMAKAAGYSTTAVFIDIPRRVADYLNNYRYYDHEKAIDWVTKKEYDAYYAALVPPTVGEVEEVIVFDRFYVDDETARDKLLYPRF